MFRDWTFFADDIVEACQSILSYSSGLTYEAFLADKKSRDAIIRNIEIIGEAIKRLPETVRQQAPHIEWRKIVGMRDRIVHAYFGLDYPVVWDAVQIHVPALLDAVRSIREEHGEP
ncbi:MAG: DUF86 domain-containing protein [Candidatus Hydrogenedentes bacterium]|nr:DUF86 domain-containing protein [Candidatus Hydrogenedentota bacterium]